MGNKAKAARIVQLNYDNHSQPDFAGEFVDLMRAVAIDFVDTSDSG